MAVERLSPDGVAPPTGPYSHLAITTPGVALVWLAGQVGRRRDGTIPLDPSAQTAVAFDNLEVLFLRSGLAFSDIVHFRTYLVGRTSMPGFSRARDERFARWFGSEQPPPNTLVMVEGLVDPDALVEIEAVGALPRKVNGFFGNHSTGVGSANRIQSWMALVITSLDRPRARS